MVPWEHEACDRLPTAGEAKSYKAWIRGFARGLGDAHAMLVLQPDGPFALCVPGGLAPARRGSSGSPPGSSRSCPTSAPTSTPAPTTGRSVDEALDILLPAGIDKVRGFALGSTHYVGTGDEIRYAAEIVAALEARGITGKHA